jgi:hypothetical protein
MIQSQSDADPGVQAPAFMDEGDIGSGEKTPAQQETEEMIKSIPPLQPNSARDTSKPQDPQPQG